MVRGTTPTFIIQIEDDIDLTEARNVYVTFEQDTLKMTKTGQDIEVSEKEVDVFLTQSETLQFSVGMMDIQLNWTYDDNKRACSNIIVVNIERNLINEVLDEITNNS